MKIVNSVDQRARNIVAAGAEVRWSILCSIYISIFTNPTNSCLASAHKLLLQGFLRQRLSGQGLAFILAGGSGEVLSE